MAEDMAGHKPMDKPIAMVVEDSRGMATLLELMLGQLGIHAVVVSNGQEALSHLMTNDQINPDFYFIEEKLMDLNDVDLTKRIKETTDQANVCILSHRYPWEKGDLEQRSSVDCVLFMPLYMRHLEEYVNAVMNSNTLAPQNGRRL